MRHTSKHRWRRFWASGPPVLLAGGAGMITALGTAVIASFPSTPSGNAPSGTVPATLSSPLILGLSAAIIVTLILLAVQWRFEYLKRTYDPTWALKFQESFHSTEMCSIRARAARVLKADARKLRDPSFTSADLDEVFDCFEDVGFYMQGHQLTPEVAHHTFHHWIRGYYSAARDYLDTARENEPSQWEFVTYLFEATDEIEIERSAHRHKTFLDAVSLAHFLSQEISLGEV